MREVSDIVASIESKSNDEVFNEMLCNFTSTMSDRADVMKSFNKKFKEWRHNIIQNSNISSEQKKTSLTTLENHHCFFTYCH